ncbi:MAG: O-antigen ligase family protein [Gemmatimonadota bacterium]|nr:O-antigen ligase family protein [Gemmatimonadota bacterium]
MNQGVRAGWSGPARRSRKQRSAEDVAESDLFGWFKGVRWSISYAAFLVYIISLVTSRIPLGTEAMALALLGLAGEKGRIKAPPIVFIFGGFVLWGLVGWTLSADPLSTWNTVIQLAKVGAIMFVAVNVLTDVPRLRLFLLVFLGSFLVYPGRGSILNWVTGGNTLFGRAIWNYIYENPNDLAALTFFPLGIALYMMQEKGHHLARLGALASVGVCGFVIIITQSRGAMLALIPMVFLSVAGHHKKLRAISGLVFLVGVVAMFTPSDILDRFLGLKAASSGDLTALDDSNSAEGRFEIWKTAAGIFMDRPVTGWGLGTYRIKHRQATRFDVSITISARGGRDAHSTYLTLAAETGFIGVALFLALIVSVMRHASRARRRLRRYDPGLAMQIRFLQNALIAFLVAGIFGSFALLSFLYVHIATIYAAASLGERRAAEFKAARAGLVPPMGGRPLPAYAFATPR